MGRESPVCARPSVMTATRGRTGGGGSCCRSRSPRPAADRRRRGCPAASVRARRPRGLLAAPSRSSRRCSVSRSPSSCPSLDPSPTHRHESADTLSHFRLKRVQSGKRMPADLQCRLSLAALGGLRMFLPMPQDVSDVIRWPSSVRASWVFAVQLKAWVPTLLWCCCCARTFSPICSLEAATPSQLQHSVCQAQQPGSNFPTSRRRLL